MQAALISSGGDFVKQIDRSRKTFKVNTGWNRYAARARGTHNFAVARLQRLSSSSSSVVPSVLPLLGIAATEADRYEGH